MKSRIRRYIIITLVLLSSVLLFIYMSNPRIFNCYTVSFSSDFNEISDNVFVSKDTEPEYEQMLVEYLDKADARVKSFLNIENRIGTPVVIYCNNDDLLEKYSAKKSILTYNTPIKQLIVIGKKFLNLDMISHELMHTEFTERVGYSNVINNIPIWFNEGLALQVDYREKYSYNKYIELKDSLNLNIKLDSISTIEAFYSGNYYHNYLAAGAEVKEWLMKNKITGLNNMINDIINGMSFNEAYNRQN